MSTQTEPISESDLSIRRLDPVADVDGLMVWVSDEACSTREQAIEYIKVVVLTHPYYRVICLNNKAIGSISVSSNKGNSKCRGELVYALASEGIATWAVKTVALTVFEERPELERVEAYVDVENESSQRVLEKAGFKREAVFRKFCIFKGRVKDMVMFSFLFDDLKNLV